MTALAKKPPDYAWWIALGVSCLPGLILGGRALLGKLGADPIDTLLNQLGWFALMLLLASLVCTPLQLVLGWKWPVRVRKTLGLAAFGWALAHLSFYLGVDQGFDPSAIWEDLSKHKFIYLGASAFTLLIPLAITSTKGSPKRLGFRRWKLLHRLVYVSAGLACVHYFLRFKLVQAGPLIAFGVLTILLGTRVVYGLRARRAEANR